MAHTRRLRLFVNDTMKILISGGPGSGCTSTAMALGAALELPVFDSDSFFHKPTDPPFQQQYTPEERRDFLSAALAAETSWILSGSIATWDLPEMTFSHGVLLQIPAEERLRRLEKRQQGQFGSRIASGGDMEEEHRAFLEWAAGYESRSGRGRNLMTDRAFVESACTKYLIIDGSPSFQEVVRTVIAFLR